MPTVFKWYLASTSPIVNFMTTTLATLASSTLSVVSSITQVNSSQLRQFCDVELIVGATAGPFGVGAAAAVYAVPQVGTAAVELDKAELQALTVLPLTTSTANAQHRVARTIVGVSPSDFTVAVYNNTTQAWSTGSGDNTLGLAFYDEQVTTS